MKKILLIVDAQYDFINGSLAVEGAEKAMKQLVNFVEQQAAADLKQVYLTADWHPFRHCSFKDQGGPWPVHCLQYSKGAAIDETVYAAVASLSRQGAEVTVITKGEDINQEEYSGFKRSIPSAFFYADKIYVAGIAGDFCVLESVRDLVQAGLAVKLELLPDCIASIDGGAKLSAYCQEQNLVVQQPQQL